MPRAKLADAKPRGRLSAYAFFIQTCREEHKKKHPEENVVFSEFSRKCSERWKVMSEKEKQPFHDLAQKDKVRYDNEMQDYAGPKRVRGERRRRQKKDPNAPKRALSGFFWFCSTERIKVRELYPTYGIGDISKELGQRWSKLDEFNRGQCEEMARKDKERYMEEMKQYKSGVFPGRMASSEQHFEEEEEEMDE